MFEAAKNALEYLNNDSLSEIKRYKTPPAGAEMVVSALCEMFGVRSDWETGKALISQDK